MSAAARIVVTTRRAATDHREHVVRMALQRAKAGLDCSADYDSETSPGFSMWRTMTVRRVYQRSQLYEM